MSDAAIPTRRSTLRLFVGAPAAAYFSAGAVALVTADPIFAAIEDHKRRDTEFQTAIRRADSVVARGEGRTVTPDDERLYFHASAEERASLAMIVGTVPLTVSGIRTAIEYLNSIADLEPETLGGFCKTLLASPILAA